MSESLFPLLLFSGSDNECCIAADDHGMFVKLWENCHGRHRRFTDFLLAVSFLPRTPTDATRTLLSTRYLVGGRRVAAMEPGGRIGRRRKR